MTVSASTGREQTVGKLLRRAFQLAGLLEASQQLSAADRELARSCLEDILDDTENMGRPIMRARDFATVTLASGTYAYTLASTVVDVIGDGMFIAADESDPAAAEISVQAATMQEWHMLSAKSATGEPSLYWADRSANAIVLRYWPVPSADEDGATIRHIVHRRLSDADDDASTVDLETSWMAWLKWELASYIASAKSMSAESERLHRRANEKLVLAKQKGGERGNTRFRFSHNGV